MHFPTLFSPAQLQVLDELKTRDLQERQARSTDPMRLRALRQGVAEFLGMMVLQTRARLVAEFGTSAGYSAIHLAAAAQRMGGRVFTVDRMPEKTAWARRNLEAAGLAEVVEFFTCDGVEFAAILPSPLDLVLVDYGIPAFLPALGTVKAKLRPGGLIFVDGWSAEEEGRWETDPGYRAFRENLDADRSLVWWRMSLEGKVHLLVVKL
ncbi:MAG: class I SAM-dependent methyltransferase [Candidatus Latescibacteria bacterium]|nr:class I SAM-dependent methyltransferase [Candidatus Latescibacterota bacterium]